MKIILGGLLPFCNLQNIFSPLQLANILDIIQSTHILCEKFVKCSEITLVIFFFPCKVIVFPFPLQFLLSIFLCGNLFCSFLLGWFHTGSNGTLLNWFQTFLIYHTHSCNLSVGVSVSVTEYTTSSLSASGKLILALNECIWRCTLILERKVCIVQRKK